MHLSDLFYDWLTIWPNHNSYQSYGVRRPVVLRGLINLYFIFCLSAFRLAMIQMAVGANKADNLQKAAQLIRKASTEGGANIVALPVS